MTKVIDWTVRLKALAPAAEPQVRCTDLQIVEERH
jgi:hypothetical protein